MAEQPGDLRVARTREAINRAFDELVLEKGAKRVTVKELADRAGINRKTFYLHYESIEALYAERVDQILDRYFVEEELTPDKPEDLGGHAKRFFTFLARQPELCERLICTPDAYDFGDRLYREQMSRYKTAGDPFIWMPSGEYELAIRFIRATALDFYRSWVATGKNVPVDRAGDLLATITCYGASVLMK